MVDEVCLGGGRGSLGSGRGGGGSGLVVEEVVWVVEELA